METSVGYGGCMYPGTVGSLDGWLSEPFRLRNRRANALRTREREDERRRVRKRLMRQLRRDRERMRQRQEDIDRGRLRCRARTIEEVLTAAEGSATGQACEECASDARRAGSILPFFRVCDHQYRRRKRQRTQRSSQRPECGRAMDGAERPHATSSSEEDEGHDDLRAAGQVEGRRACRAAAGRRLWRDRRSRRSERRRQRQKGGDDEEVVRGRLMKRKDGRVLRRVRRRRKVNLNNNEEDREEAMNTDTEEEDEEEAEVEGSWGMESEAGVQTNEEEAGEAAEGRGWNGGSRKRRLGGGGKEGGRGAC